MTCSDFVKVRDKKVWKPALQPLVTEGSWNLDVLGSIIPEPFPFNTASAFLSTTAIKSIPSSIWNFISHTDDLITIKTNFQPSLKQNMQLPYSRDADRYKFTEIQRRCAAKAVAPTDLADFTAKARRLN